MPYEDFLIERGPGRIAVRFPLSLYHREAVVAASYRFTDRWAIRLLESGDGRMEVLFQAKGDVPDNLDTGKVALEFCNEVLDQQIRLDLDSRSGALRRTIYEHAFARVPSTPVEKKKL
ncbi:MAG: His-Xaa-Ser system protein HxsD [Acidobacteriota bacterium]